MRTSSGVLHWCFSLIGAGALLSRSCHSLEELLPLLHDHWSSFPFLNKLRDAVGVGHAKNAVFSKGWMGEFKFTSWFANIWAGLQSWWSGCSCHEEELTSSKKIVCPLKGRRIPDAWLKVQTTLNATNAAGERWTRKSFLEATPEFIAELHGAVRMATVVARAKFGFLDSVPYLISRLLQPGVSQ